MGLFFYRIKFYGKRSGRKSDDNLMEGGRKKWQWPLLIHLGASAAPATSMGPTLRSVGQLTRPDPRHDAIRCADVMGFLSGFRGILPRHCFQRNGEVGSLLRDSPLRKILGFCRESLG